MMGNSDIQIPLPIAELLHVVLGPLSEQLEKEGHPWASFLKRMIAAYVDGRDDFITERYGAHLVRDAQLCTIQVADGLVEWVTEMSAEEADFEMWAREFADDDEAAS